MGDTDHLDEDGLFFRYLLLYKLAGQDLTEELSSPSRQVAGTGLAEDELPVSRQDGILR